jgi:glycosidase
MLWLFSSAAQAVPVSFNVKMAWFIKQGKFKKATDFVDVAGTFNSWNGANHRLSDTDGDSTYSIVIDIASGTSIGFKFRINGSWAGTEEFPNAGPNRTYTVQASNNVIEVWYNDETEPKGPPKAVVDVLSPDVATGGFASFTDASTGVISGRRWYFEGGVPSVSTEKSPMVRYDAPGSYDVTLVVFNATEKDSLVLRDYITVVPRNTNTLNWWNDAVFYEVFVRSFYDTNGDGNGDIRGLIQKLDYLNDGDPATKTDLGIKGIWLMPINPSPSYHGYDVTDYRGINPQYGTMNDFKELMSEAHKRGIKVIIDYVMNHTSSQHPWFQNSRNSSHTMRNYFRWSATNPGAGWYSNNGAFYYGYFWSEMPDLNYETQAVKDSMFNIAEYWIKNVGIDGFRLDAVIHLFEEGTNPANSERNFPFWADFSARVKAANPDAFNVGEAWTEGTFMKRYVNDGKLDYVFEFDLASAMLTAVNNGNASNLGRVLQQAYDGYPFLQFGTFLTNHDQNRVANVFSSNAGKMKAAASLYLTMPGIPYIYYGEELGMTGAKPDEDIRKPMQWTGGTHSGFTTGTPWRSVNADFTTKNVAAQQADTTSLLHHYRKLIRLRNEQEALRRGELEILTVSNTAVFAFKRGNGLIVIQNTGGNTLNSVSINPGNVNFCENATSGQCAQQWSDLFNYTTHTLTDAASTWSFTLKPYETKILKIESYATDSEQKAPVASFQLHGNYPNPFNPSTTIRFSLANASDVTLEILDLSGRVLQTPLKNRLSAGTHGVSVSMPLMASGVYLYRLRSGNAVRLGKMTLVK